MNIETSKFSMRGIVLTVTMVVIGEAVYFGTDLWKHWMEVNWGAPIKAAQKDEAEDRAIEESQLQIMHLGGAEIAQKSTPYYAVDKRGRARTVNGRDTPSGALEFLENMQYQAFRSNALALLPAGAKVNPFFSSTANHDVSMAKDFRKKGACVMASVEDRIILIPLTDYKAAGLPMYSRR